MYCVPFNGISHSAVQHEFGRKNSRMRLCGEMARRVGKKKPATLRCGLKSNSLRRKLEETGATLMLRTKTIYFISQISDIRFGDNCSVSAPEAASAGAFRAFNFGLELEFAG